MNRDDRSIGLPEQQTSPEVEAAGEEQAQPGEGEPGQTEAEGGTAEEEAPIVDPELQIKHPLHNSWSLWFYKTDKNRDWADNLKMVSTFQTVEDFWSLYNHIQLASRLNPGCDYSVFKEGIMPAWEDARNKKGGRWLINLNKSQRRTDLDKFWLETLLCLIGEAFDEFSDDVCGAVVNVRPRGDKLGLWTADGRNQAANMKIGSKLKERLSVPHNIAIGYQLHDDSATKSGSTARNAMVL